MTTTYTLTHAASLDRAEYFLNGTWHPVIPPPPSHPNMYQRRCDKGGLHLRPHVRYRATPRRLSPLPPIATQRPAIHWAPTPNPLELGLTAPTWDGAAFIYLSTATAEEAYLWRDTPLMTSTHLLSDRDAAEAATAALRRAYLVTPAEQVLAAYGRGPDTLCRVLGDIAHAAPSWIAAMPQQPEGHLHPARDLCLVLAAALAVVRGEPMPERMP